MSRSDPPPAGYRPGPFRWFWYAVGGRLPARYRPWVLHDLTCRTWPLRHLVRLVAQLAPVAIVLVILLPGPLWIRVMGAVGGSLVGLLYSFVFLYEATEFVGKSLLEGGLRLGYNWSDGKYEAALFGRNITDEVVAVGAIDFNNLTGFLNEPQIWGVQFKATF